MESDWKKFRDLVPTLRERYLRQVNSRLVRQLTDPEKNETERFWATMEAMETEAETLRHCLDGHSRSKMWLYMMTMRTAGMLRKEDLIGFSAQLQKELFGEE